MHRKTSHYLASFVLFCAASAAANAQGFFWTTASARSQALGGVYVPSIGGAIDALAANPAGLRAVSAPTLDLSVSAIFARGSFTNPVNRNAPLKDSPGVVPYGAFATPIPHSRFSLGFGVTPELMSVSQWNYTDAPGTAGASYGLQKQKSAILATRFGAGLGVSLSRAVDVGVSVGAVYNENTLTAPYIFQSHPALAGLKTLLDLHTNGTGWNVSAGIIARPSNSVSVNVAWKSKTVIDSTGTARGDLNAQFAAVGLKAPSAFSYSAAVHNVLPQSLIAGVNWRADSRWIFALQGDWINWNNAFTGLPVSLTNGSNPAINGLLNSSSLADTVPLLWKDQFSARFGAERLLTERLSIRGGYSYSTNPVPASTLSPLTAAIMRNQFTTGMGYQMARVRFDLAYSGGPKSKESVGKSSLLAGEYNNSAVWIGVQSLTLNTSFQF